MDWRSSPECTALMPPMDDFSNSLSMNVASVAFGVGVSLGGRPVGLRGGAPWSP
jgi:hypothetical protein